MAFITLAVISAAPALAEQPKPVLVELFTSEGCSSCPPADALLRALDSSQPVQGEQLIVLEEHVDYWDDQGWKDPFSSHALTVRQSDYVDRLHLKEGPYTPQMVVDGSDAFVGSDRALLARALKKALNDPNVTIEIASPHVESGKLLAHISSSQVPEKSELFIAIALDHAESQVSHGENGGKHLEHVAVVKRLSSVGKLKKGESFSKDVSLPLDASGQPYRIIAFLQESDSGPVLGAAVARVP